MKNKNKKNKQIMEVMKQSQGVMTEGIETWERNVTSDT